MHIIIEFFFLFTRCAGQKAKEQGNGTKDRNNYFRIRHVPYETQTNKEKNSDIKNKLNIPSEEWTKAKIEMYNF